MTDEGRARPKPPATASGERPKHPAMSGRDDRVIRQPPAKRGRLRVNHPSRIIAG